MFNRKEKKKKKKTHVQLASEIANKQEYFNFNYSFSCLSF